MLQEKLRELAKANSYLMNVEEGVNKWKEELKECPTYALLSEAEIEAKKTKQAIDTLRSEISALTLEAYHQTGEKKPANGVSVKIFTSYAYDDNVAFSYCQNNLPAALKLDKRTFEKYVKGVQDVQPLDFVTIEEDPRPTIASDLSEYLG